MDNYLPLDFVIFNRGYRKYYGIIIDLYDHPMVLFLKGNRIVLEKAPASAKIYRNWAYASSVSKYEIQHNMLNFLVSQPKNFGRLLRGINKKADKKIIAVYIMTGSVIQYPGEFVTDKITDSQFFDQQWGFHAAT